MTSAAENEAWLSQLVGLEGPTEAQLDGSPGGEAAEAAGSSDSVARLRGIFSSVDDEIITAVVTSNGGALVPSILQLIELADENDTAGCIEELEAALQEAAIRDEAPRQAEAPDLPRSTSLDEQVALAAQSDMDEQLALALQQKLDADEAAAAAAAAASTSRAATPPAPPPALSSWRRNVAKLAAKLSPSELGQVLDRVRKTGLYRGRTGTARLIDPNEADVTADNNDSSDNNEADEREYEPPVPPAPKPTAEALYESRIARARSARAASLRSGARPNQGFVDLSLVPEAA